MTGDIDALGGVFGDPVAQGPDRYAEQPCGLGAISAGVGQGLQNQIPFNFPDR